MCFDVPVFTQLFFWIPVLALFLVYLGCLLYFVDFLANFYFDFCLLDLFLPLATMRCPDLICYNRQ